MGQLVPLTPWGCVEAFARGVVDGSRCISHLGGGGVGGSNLCGGSGGDTIDNIYKVDNIGGDTIATTIDPAGVCPGKGVLDGTRLEKYPLSKPGRAPRWGCTS
jgi:hypothetical protein